MKGAKFTQRDLTALQLVVSEIVLSLGFAIHHCTSASEASRRNCPAQVGEDLGDAWTALSDASQLTRRVAEATFTRALAAKDAAKNARKAKRGGAP